jgi:nitrogen fixation protein FixH
MAFLMVGFFGVVFAVNLAMAISASTTWTGLVVQNSYVASQEYHMKRVALFEQKDLGWHSALSYARGSMVFAINDGAGDPVDLGDITVQFNRPVGTAEDQVLTISRGANRSYQAPLTLAPGVWDAMVTSDVTAHGPFEFHQRFRVE